MLGVVRFPDRSFHVSAKAQEIVDALQSVLAGGVSLLDADKGMHHLAMSDGEWWSFEVDKPEAPSDGEGCVITARINDRWMLCVSSRRGLHPDAEAIAEWAAEKLALHLPKGLADDTRYPPFGGGGGSSGSAEIGIPIWWARKARS
jgi:hypothetical protein